MSSTPNKSYFSNLQMRNALLQIEDQMVHSNWMPDLIMGINRGGCIPGVYLSHRLKKEHLVLDIRLRDHKATPDLSVLTKQYAFQRKILIIDDINDTGATFKYIQENFGRPERVKFAALINNKPSEVTVDYHGYNIDKSKDPAWIVFPWEEWEK
tara:strand:- start:97 stop:558 length:462 start_codon:yes stop_codon:yes gene_type:complete